MGGSRHVAGYDEKLLGRARAYELVPLTGALWSLQHAATDWQEALDLGLERDVVPVHARRGKQRAADIARNNAHDAHHHAGTFGGRDVHTELDQRAGDPSQLRIPWRHKIDVRSQGGASIAKIASDLGIAESCLRRWMALADIEDGRHEGLTGEERRELVELRRSAATRPVRHAAGVLPK